MSLAKKMIQRNKWLEDWKTAINIVAEGEIEAREKSQQTYGKGQI